MMPSLEATVDLLRLLADPTRVRLLRLLQAEELTVADLTAATELGQSRVSTHLGRLRDAGLLRQRPNGASTFYSLDRGRMPREADELWTLMARRISDEVLEADARRLKERLAEGSGSWAESVAGRMERHYSPGRTWQSAAHALIGLARPGEVLDIASGDGALAELIAPRATSITCLDISPRLARAGQERLGRPGRVRFLVADMHALPLPTARFDTVLLVNSLNHAREPARVVSEAARTLRPGGSLVAVALAAHEHERVAAAYDHLQPGFEREQLEGWFREAGLAVEFCEITSRERRAPHFEVITLFASRPVAAGGGAA
jgi:ArsR family transcriptional regulator